VSNPKAPESLSLVKQTLIALESMQAKLDASERARTEPIAITGMGCRFPGGVTGPESFWELLREGKDAISEVPSGRWNLEELYSSEPNPIGKVSTRNGGFLEDVQGFDANFFGISPREAATMDPQQRLVLEVAWEALEDAGQPPDRIGGSQTGVYIGVTTHDYLQMQVQGELSQIDSYFGTGGSPSLLSGRVSYFLGLHGPSLTVDTACSSSLVTVHLACQALRAGECNLALAGGVNLLLSPELTVYFSRIGALAPDGRCKAFDASADGFVRSEGCGIVVLKRLHDAVASGDDILAVIRGSAVNQDGRSNGLTAPNAAAQQSVIRKALSNAGVAASAVEYVEAHGSGTPLGDPLELRAIAAALGDRPEDHKVWVGSVKSNFGHVEAAAGIAGLMKVVLALRHGKIPAHLHFKVPTPHIAWDQICAAIPTALLDWPARTEPRFAGVSSFGLSGTNAHVILSDAPEIKARVDRVEVAATDHLLALSARSDEALRELAERYRALLSEDADVGVYDLCAAAALRREHHNHRVAIAGGSIPDIEARLNAFLNRESSAFISCGQRPGGSRPKVVFVFPGHGSQWLGMGKALLETEPEFRKTIEECDRVIRAEAGWSVIEELNADADTTRLDQVDVIQPLLFALEVALARLWRSWGVEPDAVVGHSMGEVAAAYTCGALSLEDAAKVICLRSHLLRLKSGRGGMAVVELSAEGAERAIAGYADRLTVAVSNGPQTTVISGETSALDEVVRRLESESVFCRRVKSDVAFHTAQMDSLLPSMLTELRDLRPHRESIPFYSTVHGRIFQGTECDAGYWASNLRNPVVFWAAVRQLSESGHDVFIEMSPHPILLPAIEEGLRSLGQDATVVASLRREEGARKCLLDSAGKLYVAGLSMNWAKLYPQPIGRVNLPNYPWQRELFWLEKPQRRTAIRSGSPGSPLLGRRLKSALHSGTNFWEIDIEAESASYLKDHALFGELVFPAAAYLEMAFEAATDLWGPGDYVLENVAFQKMLVVPEDAAQTMQIAVAEEMSGLASFTISSHSPDESDWTIHVTGRLIRGRSLNSYDTHRASNFAYEFGDRPRISPALPSETRTAEDHYRRLFEKGMAYGPAFRGVDSLVCFEQEVVGSLRVPAQIAASIASFRIHPAVLDAAFQVLTAAIALESASAHSTPGLYIPTALESLRLFAPRGLAMRVHSKLSRWDSETLSGDISVSDEQGQVILEAIGMQARRISGGKQSIASENEYSSMYRIEWKPLDIQGESRWLSGTWVLVGQGQDAGRELSRLLQQVGYRVVIVRPEDFSRDAVFALTSGILCGVVYLATLDNPAEDLSARAGRDLQDSIESSCLSILDVVRSLATEDWPGETPLFLVTRGAQHLADGAISPPQSAIWGLGRTLALEQPSLRCTLIDLDPVSQAGDFERLTAELQSADGEDQVVLRHSGRFVARLAPCTETSSIQPASSEWIAAGARSFRLETRAAGVLDNLHLREMERRDPGPEQIEIEVAAAGINFLDVLGAMGARSDTRAGDPLRLGYECAGRVVRVGCNVQGFKIGDTVTAVSPNSLASHVLVPETLAAYFPNHLSIQEAASIPVAFVTAWYALEHLARIQKGESVLIHSAAGGVGLAAVEIARRAGAEIFATAGTEEKREYLRSLGIQHVMDSRTLAFTDEILHITGGRGVDVVLNSLTGEAVARGIAALAPCGRFLEIGKKDIYENRQIGLLPFRKNLSYFAIDLAWMAEGRPEVIGNVLREVLQHFQDRSLHAIPINTFPVSRAVDAFHLMAQGRHTGRIVVTVGNDALLATTRDNRPKFETGTFLITGGLGALGLTVAEWMVDRGARSLVLLGRTAPSGPANEAIRAMRERGAHIVVEQADVSDESQLSRVMERIDTAMPALRGVVHAAGAISDGTALQLDRDAFRKAMASKIRGTWNLHRQTRAKPLDFFIMFSSAASVLGSPGQANYAAGNAFMDAVAHLRRFEGLPAQSVNWGPWSEIGMASQPDLGGKLEREGISSLTPAEGIAALERVIQQNQAQVGILRFDAREWSAAHPTQSGADRPVVRDLVGSVGAKEENLTSGLFADSLRAASGRARRALLEGKLCELVAQVLRLSISRIDPSVTLGSLGFDSLMALELRNRLQSLLEVKLSATMVWNHPTIPALGVYLAELLGLSLDAEEPAPAISNEAASGEAALDRLNENELASLLDGELADLGFSASAKPNG